MNCPLCNGETIVSDSRHVEKENFIRRRRECLNCGHRFSTKEFITGAYSTLITNQVSYDGGITWINRDDVKPKQTRTMTSYDNGETWQISPTQRRRRKNGKNHSV